MYAKKEIELLHILKTPCLYYTEKQDRFSRIKSDACCNIYYCKYDLSIFNYGLDNNYTHSA